MATEGRPSTRRDWRTFGKALVRAPLLRRIVLVAGVLGGLFLALTLSRVWGLIDTRLWNLLSPILASGATNTFLFSAAIIPVGAVIGFLVGWARVSRHPIVSWPATVFVDLVRGIPQLVLILFAFFWLPYVFEIQGSLDAGLDFAVLALAIHTGAYQAEIFRAGFQSVPRGQIEAAEALGLSKGRVMTSVVLPQTFRVTLPALGNEFALIVKDSSLLAAIGAQELVYWGRNSAQFALTVYAQIGWVATTWLIIAMLYFAITYLITQVVGSLEHHYRVPGLGSVAF
ncbi:MAG: amino acid ABC transporter permease [Methanobacteriota archaeon]|nr:MAG: amino acid ABC transporter permease [Euryarchaeota archaeon]